MFKNSINQLCVKYELIINVLIELLMIRDLYMVYGTQSGTGAGCLAEYFHFPSSVTFH